MRAGLARQPKPSDRGSATVLVVAAIALIAVLLAVVMAVLTLIATQVKVAQAADLAALAGAQQAWYGESSACAEAGRIAAAHGTQLEQCDWQGLDVQVRVVGVPPLITTRAVRVGGTLQLRATARAGPPNDWGLG